MAERILVIDDDADFMELVTYLLTSNGYTVLSARNGQDGLAMAQKEQPDLIMTDLMLPKLNGYEICTMLKQDTRYQQIPVMVLSATKTQEKDGRLATECGADLFLLKSTARNELLATVKKILGASRSPRSA